MVGEEDRGRERESGMASASWGARERGGEEERVVEREKRRSEGEVTGERVVPSERVPLLVRVLHHEREETRESRCELRGGGEGRRGIERSARHQTREGEGDVQPD